MAFRLHHSSLALKEMQKSWLFWFCLQMIKDKHDLELNPHSIMLEKLPSMDLQMKTQNYKTSMVIL